MRWAVLPIHSVIDGACTCRLGADCGSKGKHPRTRHGVHDATDDVDQISKWWEEWPDANIGVATGRVSGVIVVDIDPRNGGNRTYNALVAEHGRNFAEIAANTGGGGRHLFYKYVDDPIVYAPGAGIEIKADGGYVVVTPSLHESGQRYRWKRRPSRGVSLFPPPVWALDRARGRAEKQSKEPIDPKRVLRAGERDNELTRIAGQQRRLGYGEAEIYALLSTHNRMYCEPPKPDADIRRIARSAMRWEPDPKATQETVAPPTTNPNKVLVMSIPRLLAWKGSTHPYLIDPLLPKEGVAVMVAESGSYKTWVLLDIALAVASRIEQWQQGMTVAPQEDSRVLFIEGELPIPELQRRVDLLLKGSNGRYRPRGIDFVPMRFDVNNTKSFSQLVKLATRKKYSLIVGDSLSKFHIGDENNPSFMTQTMLAIRSVEETVRQETGDPCLFFLSHHMRKWSREGGNTISARARGATSIKDNVSSMFGLSRQRSGRSKLIHDKNWQGPECPPFMLWPHDISTRRLESGKVVATATEIMSGPADVEGDNVKITKGDAAGTYLMLYLGTQAGSVVTRQDLMQSITSHGIADSTARAKLKEAEAEKLITFLRREGERGQFLYRVSESEEVFEDALDNE